METKQIKVLDCFFIASSDLLIHLERDEKDYMINLVNEKRAVVLGVLECDKITSCLILCFKDDSLQVLHTGGKFLKHINYFDTIVTAFAKFYNKSKIFVDSARKTAKKKLLLLGYKEIEQYYFRKEI